MRLYTVHLKRGADPLFTPDRGAVVVREGFNWAAFFFTWIWALFSGLWLAAVLFVAIELALALAVEWLGLEGASAFAIVFAWRLIAGFVANDLRRGALARRGYALADIVAGRTRLAAELRYFEHHPALATPAWR